MQTDVCTFMIISCAIVFRMTDVLDKSCE